MKVLTINWCHGLGSTGKIIRDIEDCLPEIDFYHIYEYYGEKNGKQNVYKLSSKFIYRIYLEIARLTGRKYDTGLLPTLKCIYLIRRINPDIVHIHCPNGSSINLFMILRYLKKKRIKTIITNHAEFFYTGNCPHAYGCTRFMIGCGECPDIRKSINSYIFDHTATSWRKMYNALYDFIGLTMVAVSPWQRERMDMSPITKDINKRTIINGIDTSVFCYREKKSLNVSEFGLPQNKKIVLLVTSNFSDANTDPKGGIYFINLAKSMMDNPEMIFVVAGPISIAYLDSIPPNVYLLGRINDQIKLSMLYNLAKVTVITSRRETYGMSCAESMCCGTPVVGFCNGGSDSVAIKEYSKFIEKYGDTFELRECIKNMIMKYKDDEAKKIIARDAATIYSKELMANRYKELYRGSIIDETVMK